MTGRPTHHTSGWWIDRLGRALDGRARMMTRLDDYYAGRHPLLYAGTKYRAAFGNLFVGFSDNFCALVADSVEERLDVEGFRMGADRDLKADSDAWRIWQSNGMDAWSQIAHVEALVKGESSILVWSDPDDQGRPTITVQDALTMAVATDRVSHARLAALKRWEDDDGTILATLYLPDRIEKWRRADRKSNESAVITTSANAGWVPREVPGETWPLPNPLGRVPVVPLVNRPRLSGEGQSEFAEVIPIQNAINKLLLDMLVAAEFSAFRQRWATGMEVPIDPDTGKPVEPFRSAVDRLWVSEDPNTRFGEFEATDLKTYADAVVMLVQHIASITRTPPHYLLGSMGSFPSGESLRSTETGLVSKARRRMRFFGEGHEEVIRLAFAVMGDPRAAAIDAETIWRDPESRTESQHTDAIVKMGGPPINVPQEALWELLGFSPQQISRFRVMRESETETMSAAERSGADVVSEFLRRRTATMTANQEEPDEDDAG